MKIYSKEYDYYDVVFPDEEHDHNTTVYFRHPRVITRHSEEFKIFLQIKKWLQDNKLNTFIKIVNTHRDYNDSYIPFRDIEEVDTKHQRFFLIVNGFLYFVVKEDGEYIYDIDLIRDLIKDKHIYDFDKEILTKMKTNGLELPSHLKEILGSPIIRIGPDITIDTILSDLEFYKVLDPQVMHQQVEQFIRTFITPAINPEKYKDNRTEKEIVESKGLHPTHAFRK